MASEFGVRPRGGRILIALAAVAIVVLTATPAYAKPTNPGFHTAQGSMVTVLAPGGTATPVITVGDTIGGYMFETLPDGVAIWPNGKGTVDIYVNHETSTVPFPVTTALAGGASTWEPTSNRNGTQNDFNNSQLSILKVHQQSAGVLSASYAIPGSANYQRFCSNFIASSAQGFSRPILFTNEEATDFVYRSGTAYPAPTSEPLAEQAGVVVAYDVRSGKYKTIYGMGRHNHENSVAIPGYSDLVLLSGDDTFSAPASQLYSYVAANTNAVWNDQGTLYAFKSNNAAINDYGDLTGAGSVSGTFLEVPANVADGPQAGLESWSNTNNVFQFIRIEDIAYNRNNPRIVYFADTGEPRAIPHPTNTRLQRGPSGTTGAYPNGRIWKMTLNASDPLVVDNLEILLDGDPGQANAGMMFNPDNVETTANSLLIQEDRGSQNYGSAAKILRYDLGTGTLSIAAQVNQGADGGVTDVDDFGNEVQGYWESSGIVDVSSVFGAGTFLVTVQAHSLWISTQASGDANTWTGGVFTAGSDGQPDWLYKREGGQLVLIKIPGA